MVIKAALGTPSRASTDIPWVTAIVKPGEASRIGCGRQRALRDVTFDPRAQKTLHTPANLGHGFLHPRTSRRAARGRA